MISELQNVVRPILRVAFEGVLLIGILILLVAPLQANAQTTPKPPAQLCIDGTSSCNSSNSAESKKWNPGHYLKPQGNHAQGDREKFYASVTSQLAKTADSPEIKGAQLTYSWGMVEPTVGNYDWGPIYRHLDYLSARGLKAIISINTKCFGNDCAGLAPSDLQSAVYVTPKNPPTLTMALWEERNMDLYIDLWVALAAEFDDNPAVEMVLGAESTPSLSGSSPATFTKPGYAAQLKRLYSAQAAAFQKTNVVANINFLSDEVSGLIEHAYKVGVGRGMPDIFDSTGSIVFRGECAGRDCGVRDYRGTLPHLGVASYQQLIGKFSADTDSPVETIVYGLDNKITHFTWVSNESGEDSWPNIVAAIEAASPDAYSSCPIAYAKGCN